MRKFIIPLAIAASVAVPSLTQAAPPPPLPTVTASVNCDVFRAEITGLSPGDRVQLQMGSAPPYGFVFGSGMYWQFNVDEAAGSATVALPVQRPGYPGIFMGGPVFTAAAGYVNASTPNGGTWPFYQDVDCTAPVVEPIVVEVMQVVEPAVRDRRPFVESEMFPGLELAPPW